MALLLVVAASAAVAAEEHTYCSANSLSKGLYPPESQLPGPGDIGTLDLNYTPSTPNTNTQISGGALVCGTDDALNRFVVDVTVRAPGYDEVPRCGSSFCSDALADGTFVGESTQDVWCGGGLQCGFQDAFYNQSADVYIDYDTSGPSGDDNECVEANGFKPISCSEARTEILGIACSSDTIIRAATAKPRPGLGPQARPYKKLVQLYIEQPKCAPPGPATLNLMAIDQLTLCELGIASPDATPTCSEAFDPNLWVNKTGSAGAWDFKATVNWNDLTTSTGTVSGTWG